MTRERRLAIQMWEEIKKAIIEAKRPSDIDDLAIRRLKSNFALFTTLTGCVIVGFVSMYVILIQCTVKVVSVAHYLMDTKMQ